ncbi:HAD-IA family hydrolase [bacterium]|nr:HAD-IA family hydrolase [bacterium]
MKLRYSCLILDHDDTAVDSTAEIHYPAHVEVMKRLRPDHIPVNLENWFRRNFHPGIMDFLRVELKFTEDEIQQEYQVWREYTASIIPKFYGGFLDVIQEFKRRGGVVAVVSHSEVDVIKKHYEVETNGTPFSPDIIYGWTVDEEKRKPHPYPVDQILRKYNLKTDEVLVVDDLKPGVEMAKAAGVPIAAAGWAHQIPEIRDYMKKNCDVYLSSIKEFEDYVLN